jgi:YD repeat-containing protein
VPSTVPRLAVATLEETGLRHISQSGHGRAQDGRVYAYSRDAFGHVSLVVQPDGERWGVWKTVNEEPTLEVMLPDGTTIQVEPIEWADLTRVVFAPYGGLLVAPACVASA